jgi:PPM family protein phosphatase
VGVGRVAIRSQGATSAGHVREENEDCFLIDPQNRFYAAFDGMGGHNAGDVASRLARDIVHEYIITRRAKWSPRELLERAIQKASGAIHEEARKRREYHGMGTTVVAALVVDENRALVAHVGDSRAYLLRDGRLRQLTRDHTVVSELLARGAIRAEDAVHHPYKSVLSRNLGGKPTTKIDIIEVDLVPGDRLLLCTDGLTGFASHDAVEQVLSGAENPARATADLVDLALRGGGGDNVTAVVVEAGRAELPQTTQILRTAGAATWWSQRDQFLAEAAARGVAESPICALLAPEEAVELVAGNLCEAIFHDLQQTTGIHVWTFAENLIQGWLDQGGSFDVVRDILDRLRSAAEAVLSALRPEGEAHVTHIEAAVLRALVVAELVMAGALAERIRRLEMELARQDLHRTVPPTWTEEKTIPHMGAVRVEPPSPAVADCLDEALAAAREELARVGGQGQSDDVLQVAHHAALDFAGEFELVQPARELYGSRVLNESAVNPLLDALDEARGLHLAAAKTRDVGPDVRAAAIRRLAAAYQALHHAVAALIADACQPISDDLRATAERTSGLRVEVGRGEARIAELERKYTRARGRTIRRQGVRQP